jgi:hypothetical protein
MPIEITSGRKQRAQKIVIYGVEGVGKTHLAAKFPKPVFIDTEGGTDSHDVNRISVSSSEELDQALPLACENCETLVIDSIDWGEKLLKEKICKANGKSGIEEFGYGKGWTYLREELDKFLFTLDGVMRKGINVILVAHSQIKKFNPPGLTDGYDRYELKLDPQNSAKAREWADAVLFLNWHITTIEGQDGKVRGVGGKERLIYTTHTAAWDAKNRAGLPDKVKCEFKSLALLFGSAPTTLSDKTPVDTPAEIFTPLSAQTAGEASGSQPEVAPVLPASNSDDDVQHRFAVAIKDLPYDKVKAFLVHRGKIPVGGGLYDCDPIYAKRCLAKIDAFVKLVQEFQG